MVRVVITARQTPSHVKVDTIKVRQGPMGNPSRSRDKDPWEIRHDQGTTRTHRKSFTIKVRQGPMGNPSRSRDKDPRDIIHDHGTRTDRKSFTINLYDKDSGEIIHDQGPTGIPPHREADMIKVRQGPRQTLVDLKASVTPASLGYSLRTARQWMATDNTQAAWSDGEECAARPMT